MESQDTSGENQIEFKCQKCNNITEEFVHCEGCEEWACLNCQKINKTTYKLLKKLEENHSVCTTCENEDIQIAIYNAVQLGKKAEMELGEEER